MEQIITIENPNCVNCKYKNNCDKKTLCLVMKPSSIEPSIPNMLEASMGSFILTPEMIKKQLMKDLINEELRIDNSSLMGSR